MDDFQLLIDLHRPAERQEPGGDAETKLAMKLAGLDRSRPLKIADIGCGTGASTILLARELDADITAVRETQRTPTRPGASERGSCLVMGFSLPRKDCPPNATQHNSMQLKCLGFA